MVRLAAAGIDKDKNGVPRTELKHPCSRAISRNVRKSLEKELLRPAKAEGLDSWPAGCPFDPKRDIYGLHEKNKQKKRGAGGPSPSWTCGLCGKAFKSEHYLDLHMENSHMNEIPESPVCLADYCEMFEVCYAESKIKRRDVPCVNETLRQAKHTCQAAMSKCFPLDNAKARPMHAKMSRHYCQVIDCGIRHEKRKEYEEAIMPVIVLLILVCLIGFIIFAVVVCCVDYSDDIIAFLLESGVLSASWVKSLVQARGQARQAFGMEHHRGV